MGILHISYLCGSSTYGCSNCDTPLFTKDNILNESFNKKSQPQLINKIYNITEGNIELRPMVSGIHKVVDLYCIYCDNLLGWKYVHAFDYNQKYKEGKYYV
ncbi:peptidylprolyl isomerase, partial [Neoconidiobolus thromboides FSU 785]